MFPRDVRPDTVVLAAAGDRLSTHAVDISDRTAIEKLLATVQKAHGAVDGLVNVAGTIHQFKPINDLTFDEIERVMNVNFWGAYGASKAAVKLFTKGLYAELRGTDVAVTVVFPGAVGTNITGNSGVKMTGRAAAEGGKGMRKAMG